MCNTSSTLTVEELQKLLDKLDAVIEFIDDEERLKYLNDLVDYEVACVERELATMDEDPCRACCGNCCGKEVDCDVDHTTDFSVDKD